VYLACHPSRREIENLPPHVVLHGVEIEHFREGNLDLTANLDLLTYERYSTDFAAQQARLHFHGSGLDLSANRVRGNAAARQADGMNGVRTRSKDGMSGLTEAAHFDGVAMTASGVDPVRFNGPTHRLEAKSFQFDLREQVYHFHDTTTWMEGAR